MSRTLLVMSATVPRLVTSCAILLLLLLLLVLLGGSSVVCVHGVPTISTDQAPSSTLVLRLAIVFASILGAGLIVRSGQSRLSICATHRQKRILDFPYRLLGSNREFEILFGDGCD